MDAIESQSHSNCELLKYRAALSENREVFLLNHHDAIQTFNRIDKNFELLIEAVSKNRDQYGKTYVSFLPLIALMQRQSRSAFEALSSFQAYQAWVLLRVALEIPLIMGKWIDDRVNVKVWKQRLERPGPYRKAYTGKALRSKSLPNSAEIQKVLSRVNDRFIHANPDYCHRHSEWSPLQDQQVGYQLDYFDDQDHAKLHILAILHLLVFVQESLLGLLNSLFPDIMVATMGLESFRTLYRKDADHEAESDESREILSNLGLWTFEST